MKYFIPFITILLLFTGCSYKVDTTNINIPTNLVNSKYSTYDISEKKITTYYFLNKNGALHVRDVITFVPIDIYGDMYEPFSPIVWDLKRISKEETLEKALEKEVEKNNYKRLFKNKNEYIIDTNFAFEIVRIIKDYEDMIERRENKDEVEANIIIIIP